MLILLQVGLVDCQVPLVRAMVPQETMEILDELLFCAPAREHGFSVRFERQLHNDGQVLLGIVAGDDQDSGHILALVLIVGLHGKEPPTVEVVGGGRVVEGSSILIRVQNTGVYLFGQESAGDCCPLGKDVLADGHQVVSNKEKSKCVLTSACLSLNCLVLYVCNYSD